MDQRLIIIGGGIGGLTAALALQRPGRAITLFERASAFAEIGTGMSLWPNATRILRSLGVLEPALALGQSAQHFQLLRSDGRVLSNLSLEGFPTPTLCIHRADLHRTLLGALPKSDLRTGHRLLDFSQDAEGVTARFEGGITVRADALIGADGIRSAVREQIHGASPPLFRGYHIWRGIAPAVPGVIAGRMSETWGRGRRFGVLPIGQGRVCWYATHNSPRTGTGAPEAPPAEALESFGDWHAPIPALIEATPASQVIVVEAQDREALAFWGSGRATLLGDAATPSPPTSGRAPAWRSRTRRSSPRAWAPSRIGRAPLAGTKPCAGAEPPGWAADPGA
jgi:2-polyprenyl-6-methoxyphenol hydroxylase-like FAD-dependent oxidoreductase